MSIRPDVITRTGVVQPYGIVNATPNQVATQSAAAVTSAFADADLQPEEFVRRAKLVASALASGKRMPPGTDPNLLAAARCIIEGRPFQVNAQGRTANVLSGPLGSFLSPVYQRAGLMIAGAALGGVLGHRFGKAGAGAGAALFTLLGGLLADQVVRTVA